MLCTTCTGKYDSRCLGCSGYFLAFGVAHGKSGRFQGRLSQQLEAFTPFPLASMTVLSAWVGDRGSSGVGFFPPLGGDDP